MRGPGGIELSDEAASHKVNIEIINKETNQVVETAQKWADEAERWAKDRIWGKPYLRYKIFTVI